MIVDHKKTLRELAKKDPVLGNAIRKIEVAALVVPRKNHYQSLVNSIISQQLSTKAAVTIQKRFVGVFGGKFPKPELVLKKSDLQLRKCGLSFGKISYIKNLSEAIVTKKVDFKKLVRTSDEEIIQTLVQIKGIGRWTAEMFLIFSLGRPNIFSPDDLGLKNAIKKLYNIDPKIHTKKFQKLLVNWHPHKSTVSRILWKSLENK